MFVAGWLTSLARWSSFGTSKVASLVRWKVCTTAHLNLVKSARRISSCVYSHHLERRYSLSPMRNQSNDISKIPIPSNGCAPPKKLVTTRSLGNTRQKTLIACTAGVTYVGRISSKVTSQRTSVNWARAKILKHDSRAHIDIWTWRLSWKTSFGQPYLGQIRITNETVLRKVVHPFGSINVRPII